MKAARQRSCGWMANQQGTKRCHVFSKAYRQTFLVALAVVEGRTIHVKRNHPAGQSRRFHTVFCQHADVGFKDVFPAGIVAPIRCRNVSAGGDTACLLYLFRISLHHDEDSKMRFTNTSFGGIIVLCASLDIANQLLPTLATGWER